MKKMPAFFSWVPGRCREATEEGKKRLSVPLDEMRPADERPHPYPFLATRAVPVPQAGEGFFFVFQLFLQLLRWQIPMHLCGKRRNFVVRRCSIKNGGRLSAVRIGKEL